MTDTVLFSYSVSRARDTYGYNIVTLTSNHGKKFRAMGGGYDMHGQVLGDYVQFNTNPDRLRAVAGADDSLPITITPDDKVIVLGASGLTSVIRLMRALGWEVSAIRSFDRKGRVKAIIGYNINMENENDY